MLGNPCFESGHPKPPKRALFDRKGGPKGSPFRGLDEAEGTGPTGHPVFGDEGPVHTVGPHSLIKTCLSVLVRKCNPDLRQTESHKHLVWVPKALNAHARLAGTIPRTN